MLRVLHLLKTRKKDTKTEKIKSSYKKPRLRQGSLGEPGTKGTGLIQDNYLWDWRQSRVKCNEPVQVGGQDHRLAQDVFGEEYIDLDDIVDTLDIIENPDITVLGVCTTLGKMKLEEKVLENCQNFENFCEGIPKSSNFRIFLDGTPGKTTVMKFGKLELNSAKELATKSK